MAILALDLGGTKLAIAVFTEEGKMLSKQVSLLHNRKGAEVSELINDQISSNLSAINIVKHDIRSIGVSIPGIYYSRSGKVWAPNIPGWEEYPLLEEIKKITGDIPVAIDSDRACYILGEVWKGNAQECIDAIYLAVGTGIGAGILADGKVLRGSHDIAGAIGWMALQGPFEEAYTQCGCFEYYCSGEGIGNFAQKMMDKKNEYSGIIKNKSPEKISSHEVFSAYVRGDAIALSVINSCIEFWGMASANLVSLFNPEKIIFGGGIFGPAVNLIPQIKTEAAKWAQPVSMKQVSFEATGLGSDAGVYGAGFLALQKILS